MTCLDNTYTLVDIVDNPPGKLCLVVLIGGCDIYSTLGDDCNTCNIATPTLVDALTDSTKLCISTTITGCDIYNVDGSACSTCNPATPNYVVTDTDPDLLCIST